MSSVRRVFTAAMPLFCVILAFQGCTAVGTDGLTTGSVPDPASERQPRLATYRCGEDGDLTIENNVSSVTVASADRSIVLPAAPADQNGRYAESIYALLLEGNEAMFFAGNNPPLTCTR